MSADLILIIIAIFVNKVSMDDLSELYGLQWRSPQHTLGTNSKESFCLSQLKLQGNESNICSLFPAKLFFPIQAEIMHDKTITKCILIL